jgi:hypothetical protein
MAVSGQHLRFSDLAIIAHSTCQRRDGERHGGRRKKESGEGSPHSTGQKCGEGVP